MRQGHNVLQKSGRRNPVCSGPHLTYESAVTPGLTHVARVSPYFDMTAFSHRSPASRYARVFALLVALLASSVATLARAGEPGSNGEQARGREAMQRQQARQIDAERSRMQQRDERMKGAQRPAPRDDGRGLRSGHLSPDERKALRQQIDEAGRNVYRAPPR